MGRLEKIVVLTVLFLVAVILGVSLNQGGGSVEPLPAGALAQGESQPDQPQIAGASGAAVRDGPVGLLNTSVEQEGASEPMLTALDPAAAGKQAPTPGPGAETAAASASKPGAAPIAGALLTTEGLAESLDPDVMIYTWAEGDSFVSLAERYFGSRLEVARLRRVNEGRAEADLRVGDRIFVPRRAPEAGDLLAKSASAAGQWEGGVYRVENGDMLGKIAKKVYGSASKWRVIYEANRDVLASPDSLEVGMALRIPRLE